MDIQQIMNTLRLMSYNQAYYLLSINQNKPYQYHISDLEVEDLLSRKLISDLDGKLQLRTVALKLFNIKSKATILTEFTELFEMFPRKTPSGRMLRPASIETVQGKKLLTKYVKISKLDTADNMKLGLRNELERRRTSNSSEYIHNFESWLNNADWQNYLDDDTNDEYIDIG